MTRLSFAQEQRLRDTVAAIVDERLEELDRDYSMAYDSGATDGALETREELVAELQRIVDKHDGDDAKLAEAVRGFVEYNA